MRRSWIVSAAAAALAALLGSASGTGASTDVVREALALHRAGRPAEARELLEAAIAATPDDIDAHLAYVDLRLGLGERERVRAEYEKLALKDPSNPAIRLSRIALLSRSYEKETAYRLFLEQEPSSARGWEEFGRYLLESHRIGAAGEALSRAIGLAPGRAQAHLYLGLVHRALAKGEEEETAIRRALEIDPEVPSARFELATTLVYAGKLAEAEKMLWEILAKTPDDTETMLLLALAEERLGRSGEAELLKDQLRRLDPDLQAKLLYIGLQYAAIPEKALSKRFLELAIFLDSTNAEPMVQLGLVYRWEKDSEQAIKYYRLALEREPENQLAWRNMGMSYRELGNLEEAERLVEQSLDADPDYLLGWVNYAQILQEMGRSEEAITVWKRVLAMAPYGSEGLEARRCLSYLERGEPVPSQAPPEWRTDEVEQMRKAKLEEQGAKKEER